jgi:hypothetical protein
MGKKEREKRNWRNCWGVSINLLNNFPKWKKKGQLTSSIEREREREREKLIFMN